MLPSQHLLSNTDDAASRTTARVARRLALLVSAFAQVVGARVHDDGPPEDALGADQLDLLVRDGALGVALGVRLEVTEVADVAFCVGGGAVGLAEGVDCGRKEKRKIVLAGYYWVAWVGGCSLFAEAMVEYVGGEVYLQCGPALVQPLVLSPNWWTCMPRSAEASWPVMSQETVVGADSDDCSKWTVPPTLESPRRTATV